MHQAVKCAFRSKWAKCRDNCRIEVHFYSLELPATKFPLLALGDVKKFRSIMISVAKTFMSGQNESFAGMRQHSKLTIKDIIGVAIVYRIRKVINNNVSEIFNILK